MFTRLLKSRKNIRELLTTLSPLIDHARIDLLPDEFWQWGTYFTHPLRVKLVVINFHPASIDFVDAAREASRILEARTGLFLDWAAGARATVKDRREVVVMVKTLAWDSFTGRAREFRPKPDDLKAVAVLEQRRERTRDREQTRERGVRLR